VPQLYIRPPWEPALGEPDTIDVAIDPGQAFGTGAHATTRLCLELLLEMLAAGIAPGPLIDIGTGSGVLAISAGKLGFSPLLALDNDRDSVQAARDNARANGVQLTVRRHDLRREPLPLDGAVAGAGGATHGALTVTANLLAPLLLTLAQSLAREQRPMQHLIAGGLLAGEVDAVARALCDAGAMRERERRERGEWAALWLQAS
jgi:ribosomal protein L11 methyltransferase